MLIEVVEIVKALFKYHFYVIKNFTFTFVPKLERQNQETETYSKQKKIFFK